MHLKPYNLCLFLFMCLPFAASSAYLPSYNFDSLRQANRHAINLILGNEALTQKDLSLPGGLTPDSQVILHLNFILERLTETEVHPINPLQARARIKTLHLLKNYIDQGEFPQNRFFTHNQPIFIDEEGRYCAVGYLIKETRGEQVAQSINLDYKYHYIDEIKSPILSQWSLESGLSSVELSMIQPGYCTSYNLTPAMYSMDLRQVVINKGQLWIGTRHGTAALWDGAVWTTFFDKATPKQNVKDLVFDPFGTPIIQFPNQIYLPQGPSGSIPANQFIIDTEQGLDGTLWALNSQNQLLKITKEKTETISVEDYPFGLTRMKSGDIWTYTQGNINAYNPTTMKGKPITFDRTELSRISGIRPGLGDEIAFGLMGYESGIYYYCENICSRQGFARARLSGDSLILIKHYTTSNSGLAFQDILNVVADSVSNRYWIVSDRGLAILDDKDNWIDPSEFGRVTSLNIDSNGHFLLGRSDGSIIKYDHKNIIDLNLPAIPTGINPRAKNREHISVRGINGQLEIILPAIFLGKNLEIRDLKGRIIWNTSEKNRSLHLRVPPNAMGSGIFILSGKSEEGTEIEKFQVSHIR